MSTNVVPFLFNESMIRTTIDADGSIWFCARDVAEAIEHSKAAVMLELVEESESKMSLLSTSTGASRETPFVNESGLYRILFRSDKPKCKPFQNWIATQVLPSIRKTGSYSSPKPSTLIEAQEAFSVHLNVAAMLQVPLHLAQILAVKETQKATGVDFSEQLKLAPAQDNIKDNDVMLEPTELALALGYKNAIEINKELRNFGLQAKVDKQWLPTANGLTMCVKHSWKKDGKSGYNLKWNVNKVKKFLLEGV